MIKIYKYLFIILALSIRILSAQENCADDFSKEYNSQLGRCVSKKSSIETNSAFKDCQAISELTARNDCLKNLAKSEVGQYSETKESGPSDLTGASINVVFSSSVLIAGVLSDQEGSITSCYGKMIAIGTGTAGVAGQQYFTSSSNKKLDEIREKFKKSDSEDDYQTQMSAFQYLKEEQEAIADLAKMRRNSYYVLSSGYAAAAATSLISDSEKVACTGESQDSSSNIDKKETTPKKIQIEESKTAPDPELKEGFLAVSSRYLQMLGTPTGVAVISAAAAGWNLYLADAAADQAKQAKNNITQIDKIIAKFQDTIAGSCPKGRSSYTEGRCYCYKPDGTKNLDHSRSDTCKKLWSKDDQNFYSESSDKSFANAPKDIQGCITIDKQYDEKCKCKKFIDDNGKNACSKSGFPRNSINALNTGLSNAGISDNIESLTGANDNNLSINPAQLAKFARDSNKQLSKILKKLGANKPNNSLSNKAINSDLYKQLAKQVAQQAPAYTAKVAANGSGFSSASSKVSPKLNASIKKARAALKQTSYSGGNSISKIKRKNARFVFNDDSRSRSGKIKNFGKNKKYNYKNNDIVMRKDLSLWKVISNRYTNTGLRRLFSE